MRRRAGAAASGMVDTLRRMASAFKVAGLLASKLCDVLNGEPETDASDAKEVPATRFDSFLLWSNSFWVALTLALYQKFTTLFTC